MGGGVAIMKSGNTELGPQPAGRWTDSDGHAQGSDRGWMEEGACSYSPSPSLSLSPTQPATHSHLIALVSDC